MPLDVTSYKRVGFEAVKHFIIAMFCLPQEWGLRFFMHRQAVQRVKGPQAIKQACVHIWPECVRGCVCRLTLPLPRCLWRAIERVAGSIGAALDTC